MSDRVWPGDRPKQGPPPSALQEFVHQHQLSNRRDVDDAKTDTEVIPDDKKGLSIAQQTTAVDRKILDYTKANQGKPIPEDLKQQALKLHQESIGDDKRDREGDNEALPQDIAYAKAEQATIKSDRAFLRHGHHSPKMRKLVQDDIASKEALIRNDQQDYPKEAGYNKHDIADLSANDRVIKALNGNSTDLESALRASLDSKQGVAHDREEDAYLEGPYAALDLKDKALNDQLQAALHQELYPRHKH